jgi:hypothetical protein
MMRRSPPFIEEAMVGEDCERKYSNNEEIQGVI